MKNTIIQSLESEVKVTLKNTEKKDVPAMVQSKICIFKQNLHYCTGRNRKNVYFCISNLRLVGISIYYPLVCINYDSEFTGKQELPA